MEMHSLYLHTMNITKHVRTRYIFFSTINYLHIFIIKRISLSHYSIFSNLKTHYICFYAYKLFIT